MTTYDEEWAGSRSKQLTKSDSPRVCLVMSRFYPLFGGHIVQMMYFLPRLQQQGTPAFVVTGMADGDPKTKSMRDLWRGIQEDTQENDRFTFLRRAVRALGQSWRDTIGFIRQHPDCFIQPSLTVRGVDIYRLPTWGPIQSIRSRVLGFSVAWFLIRNRRQYDIIHLVGTAWHTPFSIILAKLLGKKTVVEMVLLGSDDPETIANRRFGKINLAVWQRADKIASLSPALTESCRRMDIAEDKVVVIPVGVDVTRFCPVDGESKRTLRQNLLLPQQGKIVLFVGGIIKRKGVDLLIDAWSLVSQIAPDAHLVCVGSIAFSAESRIFYEEQKQKIVDYHLQNRIIFTGRINNIVDYYQAADVFVLPSLTEGLPNSVLEAMACKLPPVMSDIPGISRSIIRTEDEGIVFEERTPQTLADALLVFLQDDGRRSEVGHNARKRILEAYSLTYRTEQYKALYKELVSVSETK